MAAVGGWGLLCRAPIEQLGVLSARYSAAYRVVERQRVEAAHDDPRKVKRGKRRGLERQVEAAEALARRGFHVVHIQDDSTNSRPDFFVEGRLWECYAPTSGTPGGIWRGMREKVKKQAARLVLNLADSDVDRKALLTMLPRRWTSRLQELLVLDGDTLHRVVPNGVEKVG